MTLREAISKFGVPQKVSELNRFAVNTCEATV